MKRIFTTGDPEETLYILEEDHGFELCVHSRNFIGGTAIATNIVNAVRMSRRTIIFLTEYVCLPLMSRLSNQLKCLLMKRRSEMHLDGGLLLTSTMENYIA